MKKKIAKVIGCLCVMVLLAGCKNTVEPIQKTSVDSPETDRKTTVMEHLSIVDGADTGELVLAGKDAGDVYALNAKDIPVYKDGKEVDSFRLEDGMLIAVTYDGSIEETYPARLGNISSISVYSDKAKYYDLCGLYLKVLNDLWTVDSGLNEEITYVSVDLTKAPGGLTEGEKSAVAWIFAGEHQAEGLSLSYEQLIEEGYLTEVEYASHPEDSPGIYEWKDGVLFSISAEGKGESKLSIGPALEFDAQKWRTPLGAYFFCDCKAKWKINGTWKGYKVGSEAIS